MDHGWGGGLPVGFETMTFAGDRRRPRSVIRRWSDAQCRCCAEAQDQLGHDQVVAELRHDLPSRVERRARRRRRRLQAMLR